MRRPVVRMTARTASAVFLLALALACAWGWLVYLRSTERAPQVLPAGQSWHQPDGSSMRLVGWSTPSTLTIADKPERAQEGFTWVVATIDVDDATEHTNCTLVLRGPRGEQWSGEGVPVGRSGGNPRYCSGDPGTTNLVDLVAMVPSDRLDEVVGVGFDHGPQLRQPPVLARPQG